MPRKTMLAWVSTGFRRTMPTITTDSLKTLQLPIQVQTWDFLESVNFAAVNTILADSKFQLSITLLENAYFLTFSLNIFLNSLWSCPLLCHARMDLSNLFPRNPRTSSSAAVAKWSGCARRASSLPRAARFNCQPGRHLAAAYNEPSRYSLIKCRTGGQLGVQRWSLSAGDDCPACIVDGWKIAWCPGN